MPAHDISYLFWQTHWVLVLIDLCIFVQLLKFALDHGRALVLNGSIHFREALLEVSLTGRDELQLPVPYHHACFVVHKG